MAIVFLASAAAASDAVEETSGDLPDGIEYSQAPLPVFSLSDDATIGLSFTSSVLSPLPVIDERYSLRTETDWLNDVLVYSGRVGSGQDFDMDEDTGDLYAIFDTNHATYDSCLVYRSQDGGATWAFWRASHNAYGEMTDPQIRVVKDTSSQTWVCMFFLVDNTLRMRRMPPDQSSSVWETVTADPVIYYDVGAEVGIGGWAYVTYIPNGSGYDIWVARNALNGGGWQDNCLLFTDPGLHPYPSIAAASGGNVGVAFIDDRLTTFEQIRISRSSNYGLSWSASAQVSNNLGVPFSQTAIAYSHEPTGTGWIFLTYHVSAGDEVSYYYSTNGGSNWTGGGLIGGGPGDENMTSIRVRKTNPGDLSLAFNMDPGDSTMFSGTTASNPTDFTSPIRVNDYQSTDNWPPTAGWADLSSPAVLYTSHTMTYNLYFDWWSNQGIEEDTPGPVTSVTCCPNPFTDMTTISFSVTGTDPISISVYNITGQLVKTIVDSKCFSPGDHTVQWNGFDRNGSAVVPGVYLYHLSTGGSILTNRMVMVTR